MSKDSWIGRRWKLIVNLVTLGALVILIFLTWDQLGNTWSNLSKVNAWFLLVIIPIEALNYHSQARLYQGLFKMVGNKLSYKFLYRASLELNFVNHVFPSGGVTGISYFSLRLRDGEKLTASKATLVHIVKLGLTFVSFELLIIFGVVALAINGQASNMAMLVAGSLSTLLIVGTFGFAYIVGSKQRINSFFTAVTKGLNRVIQLVRPKHPETININQARGVFEDFHDNYQEIKRSYKQLQGPFFWALVANITEVLVLYVVYLAFGEAVNLGAVILAYAVANFAGLISVLPGGVGVYEALMIAVMASAGVPPAVSLPVTVMYRVLNTTLQIPPGYYFYHKALKAGGQPANKAS
ncbi:MAG TPA: lysylphosphatidylglycerol synthase transmembrane domain-containing protein [Methylomirabilota bacterium]|nr:lysylphosphatidylglycerol synthase transmembrane domain-containing protein [Methylomirabilota bacterium]